MCSLVKNVVFDVGVCLLLANVTLVFQIVQTLTFNSANFTKFLFFGGGVSPTYILLDIFSNPFIVFLNKTTNVQHIPIF
jgi:hypothetical protein